MRATPWHEDSAYWRGRVDRYNKIVTVWLAVDDVDRENGCMHVIPGSHLYFGSSSYLGVDTNVKTFKSEITDVDLSQAVAFELRRGECSLHDGRIRHGADPNKSTRRRLGYTMRYISSSGACPGEECPPPDLAGEGPSHCREPAGERVGLLLSGRLRWHASSDTLSWASRGLVTGAGGRCPPHRLHGYDLWREALELRPGCRPASFGLWYEVGQFGRALVVQSSKPVFDLKRRVAPQLPPQGSALELLEPASRCFVPTALRQKAAAVLAVRRSRHAPARPHPVRSQTCGLPWTDRTTGPCVSR